MIETISFQLAQIRDDEAHFVELDTDQLIFDDIHDQIRIELTDDQVARIKVWWRGKRY